jgi:glutathione S-transferase
MNDARYQLFYWPGLQGRGELIRLALEEAGADYVDVARLPAAEGGGVPALMKAMKQGEGLEPFAPPFLRSGEIVVAQVANILLFLGPRLGLVPSDEASRLRANQLQLTVTDLYAEVHETHHPVATGLYYEDQKPQALARTRGFIDERMPKFLGYFERVLVKNGGTCFVGAELSYVDLSLFQVLTGLDYAFPRATALARAHFPHLFALRAAVAERPRIAAYLASPRRLAFNENGIFRRYPELDLDPSTRAG